MILIPLLLLLSLNKVEFFEQPIGVGCIETIKSGFSGSIILVYVTEFQTVFKFLNVRKQFNFLSKKY